jgi:hypothetical protein
MPMINVPEVKDKITEFLNNSGPSLPIPIAKYTGLSTMFASAILSEMLNERRIKISNLRVGSSPLYFLPGQEQKLENFCDNLRGFEKEAYLKLKENQVIMDEEQEPAIRVALRHIKDFAFSFQKNEKLFWRYFSISEDQAKNLLIPAEKIILDVAHKVAQKPQIQIESQRDVGQSVWNDIEKKQYKEDIREKISKIAEEIAEKQKELEKTREELLGKLTSKEKTEVVIEKPALEKIERKGKPDKKQEFLNFVKKDLAAKNVEIISIEGVALKEVIAKIKISNTICLLYAFDKKKISDKDLLKAYKKAALYSLPFCILNKGEPPKKVREMIEASKNLISLEKFSSA